MPNRLSGKTAVVTGSSSGLGRAIAIKFAEHGADVVVTDIRHEPRLDGQPTTEVVKRETNSEAVFVECDVTDRSDLTRAVDAAEELGGIDVMVNNAGIDQKQEFIDVSEDDFQSMMDVNAKGTFLGSQIAAARMVERGSGSIINMSSISGLAGSKNSVSYSASKGAVRLMTYSIATQMGPHGIRANVIHPGVIETAMAKEEATLAHDEESESFKREVPLREFGEPEDIANAALFLASDESKYVTAESIVVDGGWWHSR